MNPDVLVIGGGIIGLLSAYECAKAGMSVVLLEKHRLGYGASGNSAAMIEFGLDFHRGEPFNSLSLASVRLFPGLHAELKSLTGIDFEYGASGILELALSADDVSPLQEQVHALQAAGFAARWLAPAEIREAYPEIGADTLGAALFSEDGQVDGSKFVMAAARAAERKGARIIENAGSPAIERTADGLTVTARETTYRPRALVVAAGAWTDEVLAPLGVRLGVEPVRGQLLVLETAVSPVPLPVYTKGGRYVTPKRGGFTLAGTTVEHAGFDLSTTEDARRDIAALATSLVPALRTAPQRGQTAGLRPRSPDELPIIGFLPDDPNVFVATGHFRNGVMLAPVTARAVAAAVRRERSPIDLAPFSPTRLIARV